MLQQELRRQKCTVLKFILEANTVIFIWDIVSKAVKNGGIIPIKLSDIP